MLHFFRRARWDDERRREIEAHIDLYTDELIERGLPPEAARQQALREFGNRTVIKEEIYEMNTIPFVETFSRDLRYAFRMLRKTPGFTFTDMLAKVPENVQDQIKAKIPMGRFAMPEEIAKAVTFLAADGAYITGAQLNINGGAYM